MKSSTSMESAEVYAASISVKAESPVDRAEIVWHRRETSRQTEKTKIYRQVMRNAGAPGIDAMSLEDLEPHLKEHWQQIKEALLEDRNRPQPVKRVEIPKPGGGVRHLGIPTVVDRLIQQALRQVVSPIFHPGSPGIQL